MILPALCELYDRLEADPNSSVAPIGWSQQKVSFCVVLKPDGSPGGAGGRAVETRMVSAEGKAGKPGKPRPSMMTVPGQAKPSGSGINPCFLWDNAAYALGYKADDPKPDRTRQSFEAFRERHLALRDEIDDEAFEAVCRFLEAWDPSSIDGDETSVEVLANTGFGVFRVLPDLAFVHERPAVRDWWHTHGSEQDSDSGSQRAMSLVTGKPEPIARLHEPKIKGVFGAQSSGAALVSFNEPAFTSLGKSQGDIAPVGETDAFKYCTALNELLANRDRRTSIGDATVVWWSDGSVEAEDAFAAFFADQPPSAEDAQTNKRIEAAIESIAKGVPPSDLATDGAPFYVLGLSPNAARLSVRFWWQGTVADMAEHLAEHQAAMTIGRWRTPRPLSIRDIVTQTARLENTGKRDFDSISPRLAGEVARCVLEGLPYPRALEAAILSRCGLDGAVSSSQARILQAIQIRKGTPMGPHLAPDQPSEAFQCGRLFGVIDYAQQLANPDIKATVASKFLRSAMATPAVVLGRLQAMCRTIHIPKLKSDDGRDLQDAQALLDDELTEINARLTPPMPNHLLGSDQSMFMLGYHKELLWLRDVLRVTGRDSIRTMRHQTRRREWVRSLWERDVANALYKAHIPYVYEAVRQLGDGIHRVPDFLIRGSRPERDVYIEVAGGWKDMAAYNDRHEKKVEEYRRSGIDSDGGAAGTLVVLDYRELDRRKPKFKFDDVTMVYDKLPESAMNGLAAQEN